MLIILDIDQTLIYAHSSKENSFDFEVEKYYIKIRPYAREFIQAIMAKHDVAVWTAANLNYATAIVKNLFGDLSSKLKFVWADTQCMLTARGMIKMLDQVWSYGIHSKETTFIIDDNPISYILNIDNALHIPQFTGCDYDTELEQIGELLCSIPTNTTIDNVSRGKWTPRNCGNFSW